MQSRGSSKSDKSQERLDDDDDQMIDFCVAFKN